MPDVSIPMCSPVRAMNTAITIAPTSSIGTELTAASEAITAHDVQTSLCVCAASARSSSLFSAAPVRPRHDNQQVDGHRQHHQEAESGDAALRWF